MQHSKIAVKAEDMATLHGGQRLRQYCNKRTRNRQNETYTPVTGTDEEAKNESSVSSIFTMSPIEDSHLVTIPEQMKLKSSSDPKLSKSQPQVIVRKFTLPPFSNTYTLPIRAKKNTNFGKPKQRWKQLCNLQHEMTTTLPMTTLKMLGPSTPLTREYCPGTLQSYAGGKLDVMNSTLQKLLTVKKVDLDSSTHSKNDGSISSSSSSSSYSPVKMKTVMSPKELEVSNMNGIDVEEILEDVPEVAAVAEVSSTGGTVKFGPFDTTQNNIGIVGGKFVIFQPLPGAKQLIEQEGANRKVNAIVFKNGDAVGGKRVINQSVGQKEVTSDLLKTTLLQGSAKCSSEASDKEHSVVQESLKLSPEPATKEQNVVWGNLKHNSQSIKEQNVVWGNVKHNSENFKNEQNVKHGNSENGTEAASKEQNIAQGNLKNGLEPNSKEQNFVTYGNLKNISEPVSKDQNIVAVHPIIQETKSLKVARNPLQDAHNKSLQATAVVAPQQDPEQSKNNQSVEPSDKPTEETSAELKQLQQMQLEILKMKRRQNIAMQVEREVLRAKDIKLVHEVQIPARRVLLSEMGTQTNLFSLVEPGRMVEMMISGDKIEEPGKMVNLKQKPMVGENSAVMQKPSGFVLNSGTLPKIMLSGFSKKLVMSPLSAKDVEKYVSLNDGMIVPEPDKKRARLDVMLKSQNDSGVSAASDTQTMQTVSDTMSVDSGIDITNMEFQNSLQTKNVNINIVSLNSCSSLENSKSETLHNVHSLVNTNIPLRGPSGVTNFLASNKSMKCGKFEKNKKSVFDIIVQHNIAVQGNKPEPKQKVMRGISGNENKTTPMVYIPDSDLLNTPRNMNTKDPAATITKRLIHQAYEDWLRCNITDENGNIPLHKAVINENVTLVKRQCVVLCARKSKLDIYNFDKETPLHLAVLSGNVVITRVLLSFGAQPSVKDSNGNTSLHLAVLHGNLDCVNALLNTNNTKSLPLEDFNDEGYSPMHLCALNGKVEETKSLIMKGADVNLKDAKSGRTPLFHAVEANNGGLVQLLLASDANPNEANFSGHTPLSAASEISFTDRTKVKEYVVSEGINFSSKLVSLSSGSDVNHTLDEGSNLVFAGELLEDVHMDEVPDNDMVTHCYNSAPTNSSNNNSNNPWFLND